MLSRFNFRTKLTIIAGIAALGFLVLIVTNILIARRVQTQLLTIHDRYIPLIEIGPRLEAQFERVKKGMQDAVAAHDIEGLEATAASNRQFLDELAKASGIIEPVEIAAVQAAVQDYYQVAHDVSRRLMKGETGEAIVDAMKLMKSKNANANKLLTDAIVFDQSKLAETFAAVNNAQSTAANLRLLISIFCLTIVTIVLFWISRDVLRSLDLLTKGFARFSRGEFGQTIPDTDKDELGELARQANQMALQIQSLVTKLASTNKELEAFSYSVAHDLRSPLRASLGFSNALLEDYSSSLPDEAKELLRRVSAASLKMGQLIDGLLSLSRISRNEMTMEPVNLSDIAQSVTDTLKNNHPDRKVELNLEKHVTAQGDPRLLYSLLENLLGNAWKFTKKKNDARIEFGTFREDGRKVFFVRDNGAGFDMKYSEKLFGTFQRLHTVNEFEGTGIGLATVQRIVQRHHGKIWAKSEPEKGATFFFCLNSTKGEK